MAIPAELLPNILPQLLNPANVPISPYAGYYLVFVGAGQSLTSTGQSVYSDWQLFFSLGSVVIIDANGYPSDGFNPTSIYLQPLGYKVGLCPPLSNNALLPDLNNPVRTIDGVENVGATFVQTIGQQLNAGSRSVSNNYTVTSIDITVTFVGAGASGVLSLPAVSSRQQDLYIVVIGSTNCTVTPNGADGINGVNAAFTMVAGSSPKFPAMQLRPDAASASWWIVGAAYLT